MPRRIDHPDLDSVKVTCHNWLPAGTIIVSADIWYLLNHRFTEPGRDREFLKLLGISHADADSQ